MFKNKNLIILATIFILFNVKNIYADNIECQNKSNKLPVIMKLVLKIKMHLILERIILILT